MNLFDRGERTNLPITEKFHAQTPWGNSQHFSQLEA